MNKNLLVIFFLILSLGQNAFSYRAESNERIARITENFVKSQLKLDADQTAVITVSNDYAHDVAQCDIDITPSLPANANIEKMTSVELNCLGFNKWKLLVPVSVGIMTNVVVARVNIPTGDKIEAGSLTFAQIDKNKMFDGYFKTVEETDGFEASRLIMAGSVITKKNIRKPLLVRANHTIMLVSKSHSISVSMQGIARNDGQLNSIIKVFNPYSKREVEATVTGLNEATIEL